MIWTWGVGAAQSHPSSNIGREKDRIEHIPPVFLAPSFFGTVLESLSRYAPCDLTEAYLRPSTARPALWQTGPPPPPPPPIRSPANASCNCQIVAAARAVLDVLDRPEAEAAAAAATTGRRNWVIRMVAVVVVEVVDVRILDRPPSDRLSNIAGCWFLVSRFWFWGILKRDSLLWRCY